MRRQPRGIGHHHFGKHECVMRLIQRCGQNIALGVEPRGRAPVPPSVDVIAGNGFLFDMVQQFHFGRVQHGHEAGGLGAV